VEVIEPFAVVYESIRSILGVRKKIGGEQGLRVEGFKKAG